MQAGACRQCGAALPATARFCNQCGTPSGPAVAAGKGSASTPWLVAGISLVALLGVILIMLVKNAPPAPAAAAAADPSAAAGGGIPDISNMSPRERFDRLFNKVMQSAQAGDATTVEQFTPMALTAYAQLDSYDADARYHAALLKLHTGDVDGAVALADTILSGSPHNLLGYITQGTVARFRKDDKGLAKAYASFLKYYDAEVKAGRQEYSDHKAALDSFLKEAQAGAKSS